MAPKRKREVTKGGAVKVAKKGNSAEVKPVVLTVEEIDNLGIEIDALKYNNIVTLINQYEIITKQLTTSKNTEIETIGRKLSITLFKNFQKLFQDKLLLKEVEDADEKKQLVVKWILDKYTQFKTIANEIISKKFAYKTSLQLDLLDIQLNFLKSENQHWRSSSKDAFFPTSSYRRIVEALLNGANGDILSDGTNNDFILLEFIEKFKSNWDLQFYFYNNLHEFLDETRTVEIFSKVYTVLRLPLLFVDNVDNVKELPTWVGGKLPLNAYKPTQFQSQFQKAFLSLLSFPLASAQYKAILLVLHKRVIPFMSQPARLMDFLTDCYNIGDDEVVPILALNSLYELMKQYNLEYPDFYAKLYSLLTPQLLYTRYRGRFFRLCDLFLSSTHLSANLVASFIKKLARLAIASSASGVVIVLPFIYNQLKRHPSCMIMVHNQEGSQQVNYKDPFNIDESDPLKTNAMGSSLWEIETLMSHYHPNISTLAKIFSEPFRKPNYNMEDFLDWSYVTLMESEKTRRYKVHAALEFEEFDSVFAKEQESTENAYVGWVL